MLKNLIYVILLGILIKFLLDFYDRKNNVDDADDYAGSGKNNNEELSSERKLNNNEKKLYTAEELRKINNINNKYYLAILGSVYDVTKGEKHYKPGGSYEFFTGVDASRSFVTGDFKNDLNDKIDDLTHSQIADLFNWKSFFDKTYEHVGYLSDGRFYDMSGEKTDYLIDAEKVLQEHQKTEEVNMKFNTRFPMCNSEWTQEKGLTKVWCTNQSGGIKRSWSGYPRLVFNPNKKLESCACVNEQDLNHPNVKEYAKCDKTSTICYLAQN